MKKTTFYLLILLIAAPIITQAKVWRVNNNYGVVADFRTLDNALAAVSAGDSIYLEPSATSYPITSNNITLQIQNLTIIGNGYNLDQNGGLQQDVLSSTISSAGVAGSLISFFSLVSVKFTGIVFNSGISNPNNGSNIFFENCLFKFTVYLRPVSGFSNNITFSRNYFLNDFLLEGTLPYNPYFVFENNIVLGKFDPNRGSNVINTININKTIRNNVFASVINIDHAYLANNIFITTSSAFIGNSVFKNNIFSTPQQAPNAANPNIESNNFYEIDMYWVFQYPQTDQDKYFQLAPGSVAIGAGVPNGSTPVDCGVFGGPNPYRLSGIPPIPSIYFLQVPAMINKGTDMQISLKSRSNN